MKQAQFFIPCLLLLIRSIQCLDGADERYSFSLTTFDPNGKLGQVERAIAAASQGTPIVGAVVPSASKDNCTLILAAPQILPSRLIKDDGTSRFASVTSEICLTHSGIAADGRVLLAEAQRVAVEHEYVLDQEIPIDVFLNEMALLFQQYTMKAATRPFGAFLVVGHTPATKQGTPCIYRIDPSGAVTSLGQCAVINGGLERTDVRSELEQLITIDAHSEEADVEVDFEGRVADVLRSNLQDMADKRGHKEDVATADSMTILTAKADHGIFGVRHHKGT